MTAGSAHVGTTNKEPGELRRGWRNLAAASLGIGLGIAAYTPVSSLFLGALEREFGWSKAAASGALIALPIAALMLPLAGLLIDRFGVRLVSGISALGAVMSFIGLSQMNGEINQFYIGLIALNVLGCATGPVAYTRLIAAQFREKRGLALAIALFGISFVASLLPPMIGGMIGAYGWRSGYLFFAGATAVGLLAAQLLMQPAAAANVPEAKEGLTVKEAVTSGGFWLLGLGVFAASAAAFGLVTQFQPLLADRGIGLAATAGFLSLLAVAVMASRLLVGRLLDLPHPERWASAVMVVAAVGAALLLGGPTGLIVTGIGVALIGFSIGAELDLMSYFCARLFGIKHYAAIYGTLSLFFYGGIAAGSVGYGATREATGSYDTGLMGSLVMLLAAAGLFWLLGRQRPFDASARAH